MIRYGIVTHGGVGSSSEWKDGCERAAKEGQAILQSGGSALDAVQAAAMVLENDGRFNAGSGSILRLDGKTMEMDASMMNSEGQIGAVAALQAVRNPIRVAREVMDTPHILLAGEGATRFAHQRGVAEPHPGANEEAVRRFQRLRTLLGSKRHDELRKSWRSFDLRSHWNFDVAYDDMFGHGDTIGAVALDTQGSFAVANSTGGASPMLAGRVGDTPLPGCGFYAGPQAAVAATGIGEEIIRRMVSMRLYEDIRRGTSVEEGCKDVIGWFPKEYSLGVISISREGVGVENNRDMAWAKYVQEEK